LIKHRKEKGSQDLDFLEKVDDEKSKGELLTCYCLFIVSRCFVTTENKITCTERTFTWEFTCRCLVKM